MQVWICRLVIGALLFAGRPAARSEEPPSLPADLPATFTVGGTTYEEVQWLRQTPSGVKIRHKAGVTNLRLEKLPADIQKRIADHQAQLERAAAAASNAPPAQAGEAPATGAPAVAPPRAEPLPARLDPAQLVKYRGSLRLLDEINGFRDLQFGQSRESISGLKVLEDANGMQIGARESDELVFHSIPLEKIRYVFEDGTLSRVEMWTPAREDLTADFRQLLELFTGWYGDFYDADPTGTHFAAWQGRRARAELSAFDELQKIQIVLGGKRSRATVP